jgi:hypothetical protein
MLGIFLSVALLWVSGSSAQESASAKPPVRACPDSWNDAALSGKKKQSSGKNKIAPKPSGACIELASSPLDIQEYLQAYGRQQRWAISADQLNEDSWAFSLELDADELIRDTAADSNPKGIAWTHGSVRVHIQTVLLPDGFARTIVRASFRGFGRNSDQFAVHREYWELESSNSFENSLVAALRKHFSELPGQKSLPPASEP